MGPLAALSVFLNLHSTDVDLQALRAEYPSGQPIYLE